MRNLSLIVSMLVLLGCTEHHTDLSGPVAIQKQPAEPQAHRGASISFPATSGTASGYLATPATKGFRHPALVVIQEWWGVNDWIKENADRFAEQGYVALAPDLYRGKIASTPDEAHELMRGLPDDRAMADLKGAVAYLAANPEVDPQRIGVIGWCMGGGWSLMLALNEPRIHTTVMNYGHLMNDPANLSKLNSPLLGNFGADDRGIPAADVAQFGEQLKKLGKQADLKVYPGAGHGFMNPGNKSGYNAEAAADAWKRIDGFLAAGLHP